MQLHAHRSDRAEPAAAIRLAQAQFDDVYEAYVQRIYGFVFTHVGNREDAEDVTSQVFIKAYKNLASFEGRGSLQGWLFQIARMAVADFWRERYKLQAVPLTQSWDVAEPESSPEVEQPAREARVKQLLEQLPDNYREVLVQRFFLRSSIAETARTLGVTEANARVLQFRALRRAAEVARTEAW